MSSHSQAPLDSIDRFISVAAEIAQLPILGLPKYEAAAEDLYQIAKKLLDANENMARWLYRFLQFNFNPPDARARFLALVQDYRTAKAGPELQEMKFNCGDINSIWHRGNLNDVLPQDQSAHADAIDTFMRLGSADFDMVNFIYKIIVGSIDKFVGEVERHIDRSDFNSAEAQRLEFKVAAAHLTESLERLGGGLSDLVLQYARLAKRHVTLD